MSRPSQAISSFPEQDPDFDSLTNQEEAERLSNPSSSDTDGDGLADAMDAMPAHRGFAFLAATETRYACLPLPELPDPAAELRGINDQGDLLFVAPVPPEPPPDPPPDPPQPPPPPLEQAWLWRGGQYHFIGQGAGFLGPLNDSSVFYGQAPEPSPASTAFGSGNRSASYLMRYEGARGTHSAVAGRLFSEVLTLQGPLPLPIPSSPPSQGAHPPALHYLWNRIFQKAHEWSQEYTSWQSLPDWSGSLMTSGLTGLSDFGQSFLHTTLSSVGYWRYSPEAAPTLVHFQAGLLGWATALSPFAFHRWSVNMDLSDKMPSRIRTDGSFATYFQLGDQGYFFDPWRAGSEYLDRSVKMPDCQELVDVAPWSEQGQAVALGILAGTGEAALWSHSHSSSDHAKLGGPLAPLRSAVMARHISSTLTVALAGGLWRNGRLLALQRLLPPEAPPATPLLISPGIRWPAPNLVAAALPAPGRYALLLPVEMAVDANRDGTVKFAGNFDSTQGKPQDKTEEAKPYGFWCNDDHDGTGDGAEGSSGAADSEDDEIKSKRDLEDFTRLHLYFGGLQAGIADGTFKIGLKWKNTGALKPVIKVYQAVEADGGTAYLSSETTAAAQIGGDYKTAKATVSAESTTAAILPTSVFANFSAENPVAHLLFEGVSEGKGQLIVTLHKADGTEIGEGPGVWLDLKNIHQMYERGSSNPINMIAPFDRDSNFDINHASVTTTGSTFQKPPDETSQCMIYVHGWNTDVEGYHRNCATMYKRLWHRGFKGRFAGFRWDTLVGGASESFHVSEWRGYKFGKSLHDYVTNLTGRLPNYSINVIAHSLGSAALTVALDRGAAIDNCIYTQGALTAHVFDPNAPMRINPLNPIPAGNFNTPDLATDGGYRDWLAPSAVNVVNFYNEGDNVLNVLWKAVQNGKPHNASGPGQYKYTASTGRRWIEYSSGSLPTRDVFDNHESMAFVAIGRADAIGAEEATGGAVDRSFNLGSGGLTYGGEHSPQFDRHIQKNLIPYYNEVMDSFNIPFNP